MAAIAASSGSRVFFFRGLRVVGVACVGIEWVLESLDYFFVI
jgi:hypothetical protein